MHSNIDIGLESLLPKTNCHVIANASHLKEIDVNLFLGRHLEESGVMWLGCFSK
jgi:hypothetical protein